MIVIEDFIPQDIWTLGFMQESFIGWDGIVKLKTQLGS